jgi:hypothetical protein
MITYTLLAALYQHWTHPVNPVYRNDQRIGPPWQRVNFERWFGRVVRIGLVVGLVTVGSVALRVITNDGALWTLSTVMLQLLCLSAATIIVAALVMFVFVWPVAVAVLASGTIVRERENRTLTALLATPLNWNDVLTAKLAAALRWLSRPFEVMTWVQGLCVLLVFIIVIAQTEKVRLVVPPWVTVVLCILATIQFAIARIQDYSTAGIIGMASSIFAETRQTASVLAILLSTGLLVLRLLLTAFFLAIAQISPSPPPQGVLILLATGPTTAIALACTRAPALAFFILLALPALREAGLQASFRWIVRQLGTAAGNG